jgi:spore germination cell wall hydrolase CwlJ-like protein
MDRKEAAKQFRRVALAASLLGSTPLATHAYAIDDIPDNQISRIMLSPELILNKGDNLSFHGDLDNIHRMITDPVITRINPNAPIRVIEVRPNNPEMSLGEENTNDPEVINAYEMESIPTTDIITASLPPMIDTSSIDYSIGDPDPVVRVAPREVFSACGGSADYTRFFQDIVNNNEDAETSVTSAIYNASRQAYPFAYTSDTTIDSRDDRRDFQRLLNLLEAYGDDDPLVIDGSFGSRTIAAIQNCQTHMAERYVDTPTDGSLNATFLQNLAYEATKMQMHELIMNENINYDYPDFTEEDVDILARTIFGEARGEGAHGMQFVASVIMTRYYLAQINPAYARQFGSTPVEVATKANNRGVHQFSAWNSFDRNYRYIQSVDLSNPSSFRPGEMSAFEEAMEAARLALSGQLIGFSDTADHYHTIAMRCARWSCGRMPVIREGEHIGFQLKPETDELILAGQMIQEIRRFIP